MTIALQQQRHVEHRQRRPAAPATVEESPGLQPHQRVDDGLQPGQRRGVAEHLRPQGLAVDGTVPHHAGKGGRYGRHRGPPRQHQAVDGGVGVVHRQSQAAQHGGRRRLAHADRPGEAQDEHQGAAVRTPLISWPAPDGCAENPAAAAAVNRAP